MVQLAQALNNHPDVARVDLVTRQVIDSSVSEDYAKPIECLSDTLRIVRIEAGPEEYIPKEQLWDHLDNFSDNLATALNEEDKLPDILHSHYADAGYVGAHISNQFGIPLIHTGHSLGRVKRSRLLASGLTSSEIEERYNIIRRIEAEELTLAVAERVITSTHQEIQEQYELYDHYQPEQMRIIPPGTNLKKFMPPTGQELDDPLFDEITSALKEPDKPIILALSRPDKRKNIVALVEAYGESPELQRSANLVIIAGNRDDIDELDEGAQEVFYELLVTIDRYDLYGKVSMPKHHQRDQVPMFYRMAAASGGVFVNPALTEPFGLTLIEAAASGLPIVATEDGGPQDIISNCENGFLINPLEVSMITDTLRKVLDDKTQWHRLMENGIKGVREHYSWDAHVKHYIKVIKPIVQHSEILVRKPLQRRLELYRDRIIVSDLDQNLIGDDASLKQLSSVLRQHRKSTGFVIATGRRLDSALKLIKKLAIQEPDILITSGGTEIYYPPKLTTDVNWTRHIDHHWTPHTIRELLKDFPGLKKQPRSEQSRFKLSYYIDPELVDVEEINRLLHQEEQSIHLQVAFGQYLDILPQRASKGMALRYIAERWQIPLEHVFVAGGSGADEDMMRGNTLAAVIANRHHEELSHLEDIEHIYFASKPYAKGILEALDFYDFFHSHKEVKEDTPHA